MTKTLVGTPDPDDKDKRLDYWEARARLVELCIIIDRRRTDMSAEHMRPEGLSHGYFCFTCGGGCNMYATGHGPGKCEPNPELVAQLSELNK